MKQAEGVEGGKRVFSCLCRHSRSSAPPHSFIAYGPIICIMERERPLLKAGHGLRRISHVVITSDALCEMKPCTGKSSAMDFAWDKKYSVDVASIDEQHKPIIEILNEIHRPDESIDMGAVTRKLLDYTQTHFTFEEGLMENHDYDDKHDHKEQHDRFINMIRAYIIDKNDSNAKSMSKMILMRWFIAHITSDAMDKRLGRYLSERDVQ